MSLSSQSISKSKVRSRILDKPKVAVVYTTPDKVIDDIARAMDLAEYKTFLSNDLTTLLKVNISWQHYYPACSTTPWQLEGVTKTLRDSNYERLISTHNGTVVVDAKTGAINNKHDVVEKKHNIESVHLESVKWSYYEPKTKMRVLDKVYPEGIQIPEMFMGTNIIHLPTAKTHVFTTMTGAMKNAFGGLLNHKRHWTHSVIHETLVDLLHIQKEIHPGIFAVTDGTFAGDGPGPRAMRWHEKNVILASADQVAIDAVVAKMMGFDPMAIKFIRLAHESGLGCGNVSQIECVGDDISGVNWQFATKENTFASRIQKLIYWGHLKPLEYVLLRSPLVGLSYLASNLYHNAYWIRFVGNRRVAAAMKTDWGKLFQKY